jgi:hypothetical protein
MRPDGMEHDVLPLDVAQVTEPWRNGLDDTASQDKIPILRRRVVECAPVGEPAMATSAVSTKLRGSMLMAGRFIACEATALRGARRMG